MTKKKEFWMHFDVDEPDEWVRELAENKKIRGNVLDAGCGPGSNALYLAGLGFNVLGVDLIPAAIKRAQQKAMLKKLTARFQTADICHLYGCNNYFDTVVDIGCFHSMSETDQSYYVEALSRLCKHGATLYLRAFSDANLKKIYPPGLGWPAITESRIRAVFGAHRWRVKQLVQKKVNLLTMEGRVYARFAEIVKR